MRKRLNILLTGATGGVGLGVLKELRARKAYNVTVFEIKSPQTKQALRPYRKIFNIVYGDIRNKKDVEKVSINQDVVIHLAALIPPLADEKPKLAYQINVEGTQNLIDALEKNSPNSFFLYSSSISVYGDRIKHPYIKVTDPLIPSKGDEYGLTKISAEKIIQESKLKWSIFRLAAIMGKHKISKLMFHQPLNTQFEIATLSDTARAFVNAIEKTEKLEGRIFNLGGGAECRMSYEDFLKKSFEIFGLGELDFEEDSFAEKNFHCGFYEDGDDLEDILKFRKDTFETYFKKEKKKVSSIQYWFTSRLKRLIKSVLQRKSEPFLARKKKDKEAIEHFFIKNGIMPKNKEI